MIKAIQNSFTGGEISPAMYGRIDDTTGYQVGLAECKNFVVLPQGPVQNRAGFEFVREAKYPTKKCVLLPFRFSTTQTMVLEFGDKYIRFHTQGATLLNTDGTPYEVETPYREADVGDIHYTQSADIVTLVHPNYAPRELRRYSANSWRLTEINFGAPLDPPMGLSGSYTCTAKDDVVPESMRTMYTIKYAVTAVRDTDVGSQVEESSKSNTCSIAGNLFVDGAKIALSWNSVQGADRYRVYKSYSGRFGFIGETESANFTDTNIDADESITPPRYIEPFTGGRGIAYVTVTNGGRGYTGSTGRVASQDALANPTIYGYQGALSATDVNTIHGLSYTQGLNPIASGWYAAAEGSDGHYNRNVATWFKSNTVASAGQAEGRYPSESEVAAWPIASAQLVDLGGGGSGAEFTLTFSTTHSVYKTVSNDATTWHAGTTLTLTGIKVTNGGHGYVRPVLRVYGTPSASHTGVFNQKHNGVACYWQFALPASGSGVDIEAVDDKGQGATFSAVVEDGVIKSIDVLTPGNNYESPIIKIYGNGQGATATAHLGETGDYPGAVTYFQQRRVFAGSPAHPQFVWMTRPGTEADMHNSLPSQSDDCIAVRVATAETSRIRHCVPLTSLMLLTASAEIRTTTSNDDTVTPTSIGFSPQTYYGAAMPQPVLVGRYAVFASERGGHVRSLGYSYSKGGFDSDDLSIRAAHLFENKTMTSLALCKAPNNIIWCVNSDGELLGCTYLPDQNVTAWHRHTTRNGEFESITCVAEDDEDALYAVVLRRINNKVTRYIERLHTRKYTNLSDCFYVDAGVTYEGSSTASLRGLEHLEGCEVAILADGKVLPNQKVTDGKITLEHEANRITVGLPIDASITTLPVIMQDKDGGAGRGKMKNICNVFVRVYQTSGIQIGPSEDDLREYSQRQYESYGTPPAVISKEVGVLVSPAWSDGGQMVVKQPYPLPLTICSIAGEVAT